MWNVTYHSEIDTQYRMKDLEQGFKDRALRREARKANPSRANILFNSALASVGRTLERGSNAVRELFAPANKPSAQCC